MHNIGGTEHNEAHLLLREQWRSTYADGKAEATQIMEDKSAIALG